MNAGVIVGIAVIEAAVFFTLGWTSGSEYQLAKRPSNNVSDITHQNRVSEISPIYTRS